MSLLTLGGFMSRRLIVTLALGGLAALTLASGQLSFGGKASANPDPALLSPDDVANIERIERYLNRLDTIQARFVQVSSNGDYAEGQVFVSRPDNLRFDYDPPSTVLLISDGVTLLFYDRELKQASFIPLWETPLWFLVREDIRLTEGLEVLAIEEALGTLSVTLQDPENRELGTVTLIFSNDPLTLRKWEVLDSRGVVTQVSLINPQYGQPIDQDLFDYGDLPINKGQRRDER